jgi:hypothetical protein
MICDMPNHHHYYHSHEREAGHDNMHHSVHKHTVFAHPESYHYKYKDDDDDDDIVKAASHALHNTMGYVIAILSKDEHKKSSSTLKVTRAYTWPAAAFFSRRE